MIRLVRTHSAHVDFINLVKKLDSYLAIVDGDDHEFYNQYNNIDTLKHVVLIYFNETPVGCGAFKAFDKHAVEIKRMYTDSKHRGKGIASKILEELEIWAKELNYTSTILETGKDQVDAVQFYKKNRYQIIPNYGPYKNVKNSVCFKKRLKK